MVGAWEVAIGAFAVLFLPLAGLPALVMRLTRGAATLKIRHR
jgi:hypothetical protein